MLLIPADGDYAFPVATAVATRRSQLVAMLASDARDLAAEDDAHQQQQQQQASPATHGAPCSSLPLASSSLAGALMTTTMTGSSSFPPAASRFHLDTPTGGRSVGILSPRRTAEPPPPPLPGFASQYDSAMQLPLPTSFRSIDVERFCYYCAEVARVTHPQDMVRLVDRSEAAVSSSSPRLSALSGKEQQRAEGQRANASANGSNAPVVADGRTTEGGRGGVPSVLSTSPFHESLTVPERSFLAMLSDDLPAGTRHVVGGSAAFWEVRPLGKPWLDDYRCRLHATFSLIALADFLQAEALLELLSGHAASMLEGRSPGEMAYLLIAPLHASDPPHPPLATGMHATPPPPPVIVTFSDEAQLRRAAFLGCE